MVWQRFNFQLFERCNLGKVQIGIAHQLRPGQQRQSVTMVQYQRVVILKPCEPCEVNKPTNRDGHGPMFFLLPLFHHFFNQNEIQSLYPTTMNTILVAP